MRGPGSGQRPHRGPWALRGRGGSRGPVLWVLTPGQGRARSGTQTRLSAPFLRGAQEGAGGHAGCWLGAAHRGARRVGTFRAASLPRDLCHCSQDPRDKASPPGTKAYAAVRIRVEANEPHPISKESNELCRREWGTPTCRGRFTPGAAATPCPRGETTPGTPLPCRRLWPGRGSAAPKPLPRRAGRRKGGNVLRGPEPGFS